MEPLKKLSLADLKTLADRIQRPPEVALRLNQLLNNPSVNAAEIANVIKLDTRMTAQVLRICNSAAYGLSRNITTVKEAVALIGTNAIVSMVYAILAKSTLSQSLEGYGLGQGELFYNALTGAMYAKELATSARTPDRGEPIDPEQVFTGAILRDIGKLLIQDVVGEAYFQIEQYAMERQVAFPQAEKEIIGINHLEAGHYLAKVWSLPDVLVKCIRYKTEPSALPEHDPFRKQHFPIVGLVHLGDTFARMNGVGIGVDGLMYTVDEEALKLLPEARTDDGMEFILARLLNLHAKVDEMVSVLDGAHA